MEKVKKITLINCNAFILANIFVNLFKEISVFKGKVFLNLDKFIVWFVAFMKFILGFNLKIN